VSIYDIPHAGKTLLFEDAALRQTVEAEPATTNITFAYLPGQAPRDEYSDFGRGLCDAEWPEIQADRRMPHPFYIATANGEGGLNVELRLMDPQFHFKAGSTSFVRVINQATYSVKGSSLALHSVKNFVFDPEQKHKLTRGDLELPLMLRGVIRSLRLLRHTYPAGMHGYWDVQ